MCDEVTSGPIQNTSESEVGIQRDFPAAYNAILSWRRCERALEPPAVFDLEGPR